MKSDALVSIIIPTYNHREHVADAIESALAQTYPEFEIIVVDDGSTDGTGEFLRKQFGEEITYSYQQNKGRGAARNHGLALSRGKYIQFLDADDLIMPDKLERHVDFLERKTEYAAVYGHCLIYTEGQNREYVDFPKQASCRTGDVLSEEINDPFLLPIIVLIRKEWVLRVGCFDESLRSNEDWDLWLRIANAGGKFAYLEGPPVALYRARPYNPPEAAQAHIHSGVLVLRKLSRAIEDRSKRKRLRINTAVSQWLFADGKALADLGKRWLGVKYMLHALLLDRTSLDYRLAALVSSALLKPARANALLSRLGTVKSRYESMSPNKRRGY